MGSIHEASCECGFKTDVTVGGGRYGSKSYFPFYCPTCGLVEVNTTPLKRDSSLATCPHCNTAGIVQYGAPPVSLYDMRPGKAWQFWREKPQAALQWGSREAAENGHLCPACQKMTLTFSPMPSIMFD